MAMITQILLATCLVLVVQGASLNLDQNITGDPKPKDVNVSNKNAEKLHKAFTSMSTKGVHFGSNDKIAFNKNPNKISEVSIQDITEGGTGRHLIQRPIHINGKSLRTLSNMKRPLVSKGKFIDTNKIKEFKFIVNNRKSTNFEVTTIKNEIFGRGNIYLDRNGVEDKPSPNESKRIVSKKEDSISAVVTDKDNVPLISLNVHNLNAPNEGLIYVNNPGPSVALDRSTPGKYILVNVSGEPALIPSILLGKSGLIPHSQKLNSSGIITGFPFFDFWPQHPIKIPADKLVTENNAILDTFKYNKTNPALLKERLKHLEAFMREKLPIPKLLDGSFDWDKITSHVIKPEILVMPGNVSHDKKPLANIGKEHELDQGKKDLIKEYMKLGISIPKFPNGEINYDAMFEKLLDRTTVRPITVTRKPVIFDFHKQFLLTQLEKYGVPVPRYPDGSVNWDQIGVILNKFNHYSTTVRPIVEVTRKPIVVVNNKPSINSHKQFMITEHSKLGLPIPKNFDGSINWNLLLKHLVDAEEPNLDSHKQFMITEHSKLGLPIPKNIDGSINWNLLLKHLIDAEKTTNEQQLLLTKLYKLGIPIPKLSNGSIDWEKVITYLSNVGTEKPIKPTLTPEMQEIHDLYIKLGLKLPKKSDGSIDWTTAYKYLEFLQQPTEKPVDKKKQEEEYILAQLTQLGIEIPKLPNGQVDWLAVREILKNGGTTEKPVEVDTENDKAKGVIVLGKTDLLSTFKELGLPSPKKDDGSIDWDFIIKYLIEHGYKIETGSKSGATFSLDNLNNMSVADRLKLIQRLQNLGLPIPKLPNGKVNWKFIYAYLISNGYQISSDSNPGSININNLGLMERLELLEKLKKSGIAIPKLPNGNLDWVAISQYFPNNNGLLTLEMVNRMSVQDRLKLLNQIKSLGIPLYKLPNGQFNWAKILNVVRGSGYKLTGGNIVREETNGIASKLTTEDKMQLLEKMTQLRLPIPKLPGGSIDWNSVVSQLRRAKISINLKPRPGILGTLGSMFLG